MAFQWSQKSTYTVTGGPLSASANPGVISPNAIDVNGSVWSVNAANQLLSTYVASNPWNVAELAMPSVASGVDQQYKATLVQLATSSTVSIYAILRYIKSGGNTSGYVAGVTSTAGGNWNLYIRPLVSGALTGSSTTLIVPTVVGTTYILVCSVVQTSATTSTITNTLYAADGVTVIGTVSATNDTTSALQNVSGGIAIFQSRASGSDTYIATTAFQTFLPGAATTYTITGPTTGVSGAASSAFTVIADGVVGSTVNVAITATDGTVTTTPVSLASSTTVIPFGMFTYTPAAPGAKTLTPNSGGALIDPNALSYTSNFVYQWSQKSTYMISGGPIAASASPGAIYTASGGATTGWNDVNGSVWSVNASNQLSAAYGTGATPWQLGELVAGTAATGIDQQYEGTVVPLALSTSASNFSILRYTKSGGLSSGYVVGVTSNPSQQWNLYINTLVGGVLGSSTQGASPVAIAAGTTYKYVTSVVQTSATATVVKITLYAADGVTVLETLSHTDSMSALQNVSGGVAMFEVRGSSGDSHIATTQLQTFLPGAATAYSVTGPAFGAQGVASAPFTVQANGILTSAVNVSVAPTPDGTVATSPVNLAVTTTTFPYGSFTYTPPTTGAKTLSFSNSGTLTDQSPSAYNSNLLITVDSNAFHFSPCNWSGDAGRGGSVYRKSWNNGAYFTVKWNASTSPTAILLIAASTASNMLSYVLNGVMHDNVAANGSITLSNVVPSAVNTLTVYLRNSTQAARWGQTPGGAGNIVCVQGFEVDADSSAYTTQAWPAKWVMIIGDSITEGIIAGAGATDDNLADYSWNVGQAFIRRGYDYCISACGNSGWLNPGDSTADVPAWYPIPNGTGGRYSLIDSGVSMLDTNGQLSAYGSTGTAPSAIIINYGTNEALFSQSSSNMALSIEGWLSALATQAPAAKAIVLMPFGLQNVRYNAAYAAALITGVTTAQAAGSSAQLLNLGQYVSDTMQNSGTYYLAAGSTVHFNQTGYALVAPMVAQAVFDALDAGSVPVFQNRFFR